MQAKWILLSGAALAAFAAGVRAARNDFTDYPYIPYDHPAIQYMEGTPDDPVSRLQRRLDSGEVKLAFDPKWGYLPSLLKNLGVNADSQLLVFSKTSFQGPKISRRRPRAVYFSDNAAVGFVPDGDVMELTGLDPLHGTNFYTLEREKTDKPVLLRRTTECLNCHLIPGTLEIPGLLATSVIPAPDGTPRFPAAAVIVDSRTPLDQRWGGWYVTGTAGDLLHRGNSVAPDPSQPSILDLKNNLNVTSLTGRIDANTYLEPGSDLVALMTLEHQTRMTSLLTRLTWETSVAVRDGKLEAFRPRLDFVTDQLVAYMLFANEAKIFEPIAGVSTFTKTFAARGPRDRQGRSLRDFDLRTRLFRYPLSYMIYDAAFDGVPEVAKDGVYRKLYQQLTAHDASETAKLSPADQSAILEILRDTKPDLPAYWRKVEGK